MDGALNYGKYSHTKVTPKELKRIIQLIHLSPQRFTRKSSM